jgi:2-polyprenyl-6-methoxyphenol hydroxylase-like FAD-dependent oxidoreductase
VQWGMTLIDVTIDVTIDDEKDGVTAHFADGSTYSGDILVGADGPKSKVREMLVGAEKARSSPVGINYNKAIVKYGDTEKSKYIRSFHPVGVTG